MKSSTEKSKMNVLKLIGEFTWLFGQEFFIETSEGNFIWNDPNYGGDNTIRLYPNSYQDYLKKSSVTFGRSKGKHSIEDYCGSNVIVITNQKS